MVASKVLSKTGHNFMMNESIMAKEIKIYTSFCVFASASIKFL